MTFLRREYLHSACVILACIGRREMIPLAELQEALRRTGHVPEAYGDIRMFGRWVARSGCPSIVIDATRTRWVRAADARLVIADHHGVVL